MKKAIILADDSNVNGVGLREKYGENAQFNYSGLVQRYASEYKIVEMILAGSLPREEDSLPRKRVETKFETLKKAGWTIYKFERKIDGDGNIREKAVDAALASAGSIAIAKHKPDCVILLSGDLDLLPILHLRTDFPFSCHIWSLSAGLSEDIRSLADEVHLIDNINYEREFVYFLNLDGSEETFDSKVLTAREKERLAEKERKKQEKAEKERQEQEEEQAERERQEKEAERAKAKQKRDSEIRQRQEELTKLRRSMLKFEGELENPPNKQSKKTAKASYEEEKKKYLSALDKERVHLKGYLAESGRRVETGTEILSEGFGLLADGGKLSADFDLAGLPTRFLEYLDKLPISDDHWRFMTASNNRTINCLDFRIESEKRTSEDEILDDYGKYAYTKYTEYTHSGLYIEGSLIFEESDYGKGNSFVLGTIAGILSYAAGWISLHEAPHRRGEICQVLNDELERVMLIRREWLETKMLYLVGLKYLNRGAYLVPPEREMKNKMRNDWHSIKNAQKWKTLVEYEGWCIKAYDGTLETVTLVDPKGERLAVGSTEDMASAFLDMLSLAEDKMGTS